MGDNKENKIWWVASWRQLVAGFELMTLEQLPSMKLMRGVSSDLIYHLIASRLVTLEQVGLKAEFSRIRDWSTDLVLGNSRFPPPWVYQTVEDDRVELIKYEFSSCCITLDEYDGYKCFLKIIQAERNGLPWKDWCLLVLNMFNFEKYGKSDGENPTARMLLVANALKDLLGAVHDNLPSVASMALKALGWQSPWSPEV